MSNTKFLGRGNYIILHVQKVELTTWDMIAIFAEFLAIPAQKIGYAGLKDKHATTTQYISLESKHERALHNFQHKQIKILDRVRHSHSIRMGDLAGNRFSINLYGVDAIGAGKVEKIARKIVKSGLPNYFGYQRFGHDASSIEQSKEMIKGELFIEDAKLKSFLISVYQSYYFNEWLKKRVLISKEDRKNELVLFSGDVYVSKNKEFFTPKEIPTKEYNAKKFALTGLLCGRDTFRAKYEAREIEKEFDDEFLQEKGDRRNALVYPGDIECKYIKEQKRLNISFTMPKGSYATVFLESISGKNYSAKDVKEQK